MSTLLTSADTAAVQGLVTDYGETVTVREYTTGAADAETGIKAQTAATRSATAVRSEPMKPRTALNAAGVEVSADLFWYFKDTEEPAFESGEDNAKPPQIEPAAGGLYEVLPFPKPASVGVRFMASTRLR
jgi:hypothetical protein